jgi:hypothetical protein
MARIVSTSGTILPRANGRAAGDTIAPVQEPSARSTQDLEEQYDNPLERLQLLGGDGDAIAAFLDELDVHSPHDREMLRELARTSPIARPERFETDPPPPRRAGKPAPPRRPPDLVVRPAWRRARKPAYPPFRHATARRALSHCRQLRVASDRSVRQFAVVAISLTVGVWIVLPLLVTLSLAG